MTANSAYIDLLSRLSIKPDSLPSPWGQQTAEIGGCLTQVDMSSPIITIGARQLDYNFMAAEALWILSGERRLLHDALSRNLVKYSDDGSTMRGAYGPPFMQQLEYVADKIIEDRDTRQAVMTLWERNPRPSRDIPCTIALQWLFRKDQLDCNVFMRSSDVWLGWPYDVFNFSMMSLLVSLRLPWRPELGALRIFAGSQHLYNRNRQDVAIMLQPGGVGDNFVIDRHKIISPDQLLKCLGMIMDSPNPLIALKSLLCH